ncbi:hypothetical protein IQ254_12740 [Nodosilinea sp. LEGE 07088]|uniref:hypothetical protein n=1 Tax=Nodosilinea sp. LEGE 07088 TaxID=2777968 RepID=UPI0018801F8F|nr:hypothetical protein [Nodosilinea sp. LEGE 07088]MBE9138045.1 hypothetical protein [Nodosilinea sp. LEGE 07088]
MGISQESCDNFPDVFKEEAQDGSNDKETMPRFKMDIDSIVFAHDWEILTERLKEFKIKFLFGSRTHYDFDYWDKVKLQFEHFWPQLRIALYKAIEYGLYEQVREIFFDLRHLLQTTGHVKERIYFAAWLRKEASVRGHHGTKYLTTTSLIWVYTSSGCFQNLEKAKKMAEGIIPFVTEVGTEVGDSPKSGERRKALVNELGEKLYVELMIDAHETLVRLAIRHRELDAAGKYIREGKEEISLLAAAELLPPRLKERFDIAFCYHEAIILYLKGEYQDAQALFQEIADRSSLIGWMRVVKGSTSWLATLAIMREEDYQTCEAIVQKAAAFVPRQFGKRDGICHLIKAQLSKRFGSEEEKVASEARASECLRGFSGAVSTQNDSCNIDGFLLGAFSNTPESCAEDRKKATHLLEYKYT